jgi:archaemetzincin
MKHPTLFVFFTLLHLMACKQDHIDRIADNDEKLLPAKEGQWRFEHKEKRQSYDDFVAFKKEVVDPQKQSISIVPIGKFTALQQKQIGLIKSYLEKFYQLDVIIEQALSDATIPEDARRMRANDNQQLLTSYILDSMLAPIKQKNTIAMMALSAKDLYPDDGWNYVFGLANYSKAVGVTSIYRLQDSVVSEVNFKKCLRRLMKIGHMFGIHHCLDAQCVMNGSNSLWETDQQTLRLCSHCQRKIHTNNKYDEVKRLNDLMVFFKENGMENEMKWANKDHVKSSE